MLRGLERYSSVVNTCLQQTSRLAFFFSVFDMQALDCDKRPKVKTTLIAVSSAWISG